jgi:hypothetical protein
MAGRGRGVLLVATSIVATVILLALAAPEIAASPAPITIRIDTGNALFHRDTYGFYPSTARVQGVDAARAWTVARIDGSTYLEGLSCPTTRLCVASDVAGGVVTSTDPTGGTHDWHVAHVDGSNIIHQVSCVRAAECVAVDSVGQVVTSTDPTGGASAWHVADVDAPNQIWGVSCPTARLCFASDNAGHVLSSADPTGGAGTWHVADVDGSRILYGISCPVTTLCVAVDSAGHVVTSADPTGGVADWHIAKVDANEIFNINCASVTLCVAVDSAGGVVTSSHPFGGVRSWRLATVDDNSFYGISCTAARFCVAVDDAGGVATATDPTGGARAWHYADRDGHHGFYNVSCPTASFCVAVDTVGNAVTTHNPTELVALEESEFPFHKAMARVATTETNGSGHYSFTVHLSVATRFKVVGLGSFNRGVSPVRTIYEVERYAGSITRCASEPICTVVWVIRYQLPEQVATREVAEPFDLYLGVTRGSTKPPKTLFLDSKVRVKTSDLGKGRYSTRLTLSIDVGRRSWDWSVKICQRDIEASDGFNLPGRFSCGAKSIRASAYLPSVRPGAVLAFHNRAEHSERWRR